MSSGSPWYRILDDRFARIVDVTRDPSVLFTGMTWAEGPAYEPRSGRLYFSDVPGDVLFLLDGGGVREFRRPSAFSNGNTIDREGRLITCEQGERRISRTEPSGERITVVDRYGDGRLNSPNDVIVKSDGTIWFSDPDYGIRSEDQGGVAPREQDGCFVFRYDPADGSLAIVARDLVQPNGLAFSPDERTLYIADSAFTDDPLGPRCVRAYEVTDDGSLAGGRVHIEIDAGWPDGLRVDREGRLWCAAGDGARCYLPDGTHLGTVLLPEIAANLCFARIAGESVLVVTASTSLYSVPLGPSAAATV